MCEISLRFHLVFDELNNEKYIEFGIFSYFCEEVNINLDDPQIKFEFHSLLIESKFSFQYKIF